MGQGVSDEAIRDVKQIACDGAVTYLRVNLSDNDTEVGVKGRNTLTIMILLQTTRMRSAELRVIIVKIIGDVTSILIVMRSLKYECKEKSTI